MRRKKTNLRDGAHYCSRHAVGFGDRSEGPTVPPEASLCDSVEEAVHSSIWTWRSMRARTPDRTDRPAAAVRGAIPANLRSADPRAS